MKHLLLTVIMATAAIGMPAAGHGIDFQAEKAVGQTRISTAKPAAQSEVREIAPGVFINKTNGVKRLEIRKGQNRITPQIKKSAKTVFKAPEGHVLFESFEGWDGTAENWLPEGWSIESKTGMDRADSWQPTAQTWYPGPCDGQYYMGVYLTYADNNDEWLITPEVEVGAGNVLDFYAYIEPAYIFSMENVDWNTMEYIGDKVVAATLQIWAQPEGGEWAMLYDVADKYKNMSFFDLLNAIPTSLEKYSVSLDGLEGKKARLAFRYVGSEGNSMFIDAVSVGLPTLEGISYTSPLSTLFWGTDDTIERGYLAQSIAMYPVYEALTWENASPYTPGVTYTWTYSDPATREEADYTGKSLTVTYEPDYTSPTYMRNNFHKLPTLTASADNALPASYTAPFYCLQAGGKSEITFNSGEELTVGLLPFSPVNRNLTHAIVDYESVGDLNCPIFGHDKYTDRWWLEYSYNGEEPAEGDFSRLLGILNFIYPTEKPLVVSGAHVLGHGRIAADAELTLSIYGLPASMVFTGTETPLATAKCLGADILSETDDLVIPFKFDEPFVLKATEEYPYYMVMFSGFNSDKVEYFAPTQSYDPNPDYICHGWLFKHNNINGREGYGVSPIAYIEGEEGPMYNAFAINLQGEYPWLTTDTESIELPADGTAAEVALGSYYDGSRLTVEAPAGVEASVAGRYNECVLSLRHNGAAVEVDGDITVKGPGVELSIPVKANSGIADITADHGEITGIYDLGGRRIEGEPAAGIYVVRYSDGTAAKKAIR